MQKVILSEHPCKPFDPTARSEKSTLYNEVQHGLDLVYGMAARLRTPLADLFSDKSCKKESLERMSLLEWASFVTDGVSLCQEDPNLKRKIEFCSKCEEMDEGRRKKHYQQMMDGKRPPQPKECESIEHGQIWCLSMKDAYRLAQCLNFAAKDIQSAIRSRSLLSRQTRTVDSALSAVTELASQEHEIIERLINPKTTTLVPKIVELIWSWICLVRVRTTKRIETAMDDYASDHTLPTVRISLKCLRRRDIMRVYDADSKLPLRDQILLTYLKGGQLTLFEQLKRCIKWDRADLAVEHVLSVVPEDKSQELKDPQLTEALKIALVSGSASLVLPLLDSIQNIEMDPAELYIEYMATMRGESTFAKGLQRLFFESMPAVGTGKAAERHYEVLRLRCKRGKNRAAGKRDSNSIPFEKVLEIRAQHVLTDVLKQHVLKRKFKSSSPDSETRVEDTNEAFAEMIRNMAERMAGEDNSVAPEELAEEMMKYGYAPPSTDLEAVVRACDADADAKETKADKPKEGAKADGNVDGDEFIAAMTTMLPAQLDAPFNEHTELYTSAEFPAGLTEVEACWEALKVLVNVGLYNTLHGMELCDETPRARIYFWDNFSAHADSERRGPDRIGG